MQNVWMVKQPKQKWEEVKGGIENAMLKQPYQPFINFASAQVIWQELLVRCGVKGAIKCIADYVLPKLVNKLSKISSSTRPKTPYVGIIPMDFPSPDAIKLLIKMNFADRA